MTGKIFKNMLTLGVVVFLLCAIIFMSALYGYFEERVYLELQSEAELAAQGLTTGGLDFFEGLHTTDRLTWVDADGTVLFDSVAEASTLGDHSDREEIAEALETGVGMSQHYSDVYLEKTLYYALRAPDGTVVRVSCVQNTVITLLVEMIGPILWILILSLLLSAVLASHLAKKITEPLNEIDLDEPEQSQAYPELRPMLRRLAEQNSTIRQQMAELGRKQKEFAAITEHMSEGFALVDYGGTVLSHNSSAVRLIGPEGVGENGELRLGDVALFRQGVNTALSGQHWETSMEREGRSYQVMANPVITAGQVTGAVLFMMDVTEREQRETLRREFSANVSHELKTPLTSISGFAELMKEGLVPEEKVREFAGDIYTESQRLIDLVGDIIKLSKLDEGAEFSMEQVDLYDLAVTIADRLAPEAAWNDIHLSVSGEHCVVTGVRQVLDEMIYNLCDNAIKYNVPGGKVQTSIRCEGDRGVVRVADTGIGIPYAEQERVFERFYRVDKSHSKEVGGTGLGLSIVKHGAAYHNADITINSTPGKGTTITLAFKL